jgi:peptidoglycan/LPS O-acetylase OafA/YrhL
MITYAAIFIGVSSIRRLPIYGTGYYSYGIYLYAYPIQQKIVSAFPNLRSWASNFVLSAALATIVAMASWHCIEKRILRMRKNLSFVGRRLAENQEK